MTLLGRGGELQLACTPHLQSYSDFERPSQASSQEQFRELIACYLKLVRKRQDYYCRISKLPDVQHGQFDQLLEELALMTKRISEMKSIQQSLAAIDKKTLVYHLCAKLVQLLEGMKNKLGSSGLDQQQIEGNKQEVLRRYRIMVELGEFDATQLIQLMTDFRRKPGSNRPQVIIKEVVVEYRGRSQSSHPTQLSNLEVQGSDSTRNRFLESTQILSVKEKDHLLKFMQGKQRARQKKAKIEEQSKNELKNMRQACKVIYSPLQAEEVFRNEYCLTLSKEDNMQSLLLKQLERNSVISNSMNTYNESHKAHKVKVSRFRIRKRADPPTPNHSVPLGTNDSLNILTSTHQ